MHHFQCMCNSTDLLQTHCFGRCPASSSRLWRAGCPSIVAHESKLQKASVDPAVRSGLWKNIQDQNCSDFTFRSRETRDTSRSLTFPSWLETPAEQTHHLSSRTQSIINQSINGWSEIRPLESRRHWLFIISSVSLIVCERAEMCLFISSSFSFIICFFCSSSSLSAVIVASSSSLRNWWSFSNCCLIWRSVCSAWDWNKSHSLQSSPSTTSTHHHSDPRETQTPDYNRSRSRLLLIIYN